MEEQLINFITAKLAKEKGFTVDTKKIWANYYTGEPINKWKLDLKIRPISIFEYSAPTQSLLQKWLRKEHNIHLQISAPPLAKNWECSIKTPFNFSILTNYYQIGETYEEALEEGLKTALTLIK